MKTGPYSLIFSRALVGERVGPNRASAKVYVLFFASTFEVGDVQNYDLFSDQEFAAGNEYSKHSRCIQSFLPGGAKFVAKMIEDKGMSNNITSNGC